MSSVRRAAGARPVFNSLIRDRNTFHCNTTTWGIKSYLLRQSSASVIQHLLTSQTAHTQWHDEEIGGETIDQTVAGLNEADRFSYDAIVFQAPFQRSVLFFGTSYNMYIQFSFLFRIVLKNTLFFLVWLEVLISRLSFYSLQFSTHIIFKGLNPICISPFHPYENTLSTDWHFANLLLIYNFILSSINYPFPLIKCLFYYDNSCV